MPKLPADTIVEAWISVDALLLLGCLHCGGLDSEKAQVFHRVVAPEFDEMVMVADKDLRKSMYFMIIAATILEQMTREIIDDPYSEVDYDSYQHKIDKYQPTLLGILEDFEDSVFGVFYNRRPRETFVELMAYEGWKYFQLKNLNELFALMFDKYGIDENVVAVTDRNVWSEVEDVTS